MTNDRDNTIGTTAFARIISKDDYARKPWKNGRGETLDVLLIPENATHADFDVRVAFSPIPADSPFSRYDNVERFLTLVEGDELALEFENQREVLKKNQSLRFDCELPVTGRPSDADVMVINIMARRTGYNLGSCAVTTEISENLEAGEMAVAIPLSDGWAFPMDVKPIVPAKHDAVIFSGPGEILGKAKAGTCLFSTIMPAYGPAD